MNNEYNSLKSPRVKSYKTPKTHKRFSRIKKGTKSYKRIYKRTYKRSKRPYKRTYKRSKPRKYKQYTRRRYTPKRY